MLIKRNFQENQLVVIDRNSDIYHQSQEKSPEEQIQLLKNNSEGEEFRDNSKLTIGRIDDHLKIISWAIDHRPELLSLYEAKLVRTETKIKNKFLCLHFIRSKSEIEIAMCGVQGSADIGIVPFFRAEMDYE